MKSRADKRRARELLDEEDRQAALRLDEAAKAMVAARRGEARPGAEDGLAPEPDPTLVPPPLDRLDARGGRMAEASALLLASAARPSRSGRGSGIPRAVLVAGWAAVLGALLSAVLTRWERIVGRLMSTPRPISAPAPPVTVLSPSPPGEAALLEARRLLSRGEARGALLLLDRIPARDPAYPYARRVRAEAEAALDAPPAGR